MKATSFALLIMLLLISCSPIPSSLQIAKMKCSGLEEPLGTEQTPDFSWILQSSEKGKKQTAYQIIVSADSKIQGKKPQKIWNSGKIESAESAWIPYSGEKLLPGEEYLWKVRVWDENNKPSRWSKTGKFVTGLFEKEDWSGAKWIGYEEIPDSLLLVPGVHGFGDNLGNMAKKRSVVPYFRQDISLGKKITKAFIFVSGLGHYELYVNGERTGDRFLAPGWSEYNTSCFYNTYDVTTRLRHGSNTIGAVVGNGFYNVNRERYRKLVIAYGAPKLIMKIKISYDDGTSDVLTTDENWKTSPSPVTFSSIYGGEDYDARLEQPGWNKPGHNGESWRNAIIAREPDGKLVPEKDYPLKVMETLAVKEIKAVGKSYIYDFGQNASGIITVRVKGEAGQKIRLTPAELLDEKSFASQKASGEPYYFEYTLKGNNEEVWTPSFTYYGFRYVQADGAIPSGKTGPKNLPVIIDMKLLHTRNSSPLAGTFKCSNDLFNSIYSLIDWSIKSNLASVATDCPHREKLGWLEQTHLMGNSIKFVYDIHNLYAKIIGDMIEAQLDNGLVPDIAPEYVPFVEGFRDSPEWGSACVIVPWDMYEWYGDTSIVRKAYPMMKKYVGYLQGLAYENILSHGLGDWFDLGPRSPGEAQLTPKAVTATSIYYYDAYLLSKMAALLGEDDDTEYFKNLAVEIKKSFNSKFFDYNTSTYSTGSQTAFAMPLFFGMVEDKYKKNVIANLVKSIEQNGKALSAGDIGYRYLLRALEEEGKSQLIYEMNSRSDVPGYGYQLSKGATSLTESWAALKFVSNNHMMLGHLMEWFYSGVAGIRQSPESYAYKHIIISPQPVGDITWAEATHNSVRGEILSSWKIEGDTFILKVAIPVNTTATIIIPSDREETITINDIQLKDSGEILKIENTEGKILCDVGSGEYIFSSQYIRH